MDLLGDLGAVDQLTSARAENVVLQKRVKELTDQVKALYVENESLKAEVEIYRKDSAATTSNVSSSHGSNDVLLSSEEEVAHAFLRSGNGLYPQNNEVTLSNIHGISNPLACALSIDDTILGTGGADATLRLVQWGSAWGNEDDSSAAATAAVKNAAVVSCSAPVIAVGFSPTLRNVVAAGSMDGSLRLVQFERGAASQITVHSTALPDKWNHRKYVRAVAWSSTQPFLASASADGDVHVYRVEKPNALEADQDLKVSQLTSLHLPGAVEAMCFSGDELICYARGTPYLSYFDCSKDFEPRRINLNKTAKSAVTGGFDGHVSFCVMDLAVSPCGSYLAAATDTSRNLILNAQTGQQIRNLYGHQNDGFSQPKIAWSRNGQYLLGNSQDDAVVCVWDIASSKLKERLSGHGQPLRDMCAGNATDCLVTTSFDKQTRFWFEPAE